MRHLTIFNLVALETPRRWQNGLRRVGDEVPQVPQLLQVLKKLVRKDDFPRYLNQQNRL